MKEQPLATKAEAMIYIRMTFKGPRIDDGQDKPVDTIEISPRGTVSLSTGKPILPMQSVQITAAVRPTGIFHCDHFVISNAGTANGAADWAVNNIKIDGVAWSVRAGDVLGSLFAPNARFCSDEIAAVVRCPVQLMTDIVMDITCIGLNENGCPFFGAMMGCPFFRAMVGPCDHPS